jgi:GNAT superfamily N-acetyltransferase
LVSDSHALGPELEKRGFVRDYSWMKFSRGVGPREAQSDLQVVNVGSDGAGDFARAVVGGYEMPEWLLEFNERVVGRPGWSCYVAYDGDAPAGAGALFVPPRADPSTGRVGGLGPATLPAKIGWLGFGATLPEYRGRGAQSAILAGRIEDARKQGCSTVVTETGELDEGRPSSSYRNILRAGFREAGVRPNYRAP